MSFNAPKGSADFKLILTGLQKVGAAIVSHQSKECQHRWMNSSFRPIISDLLNKTKTLNEQNNQNVVRTLEKKGRITSEKISMVAEGIEQFVKFKLSKKETEKFGSNLRQQSANAAQSVSTINHETDIWNENERYAEVNSQTSSRDTLKMHGITDNIAVSMGTESVTDNVRNTVRIDQQKEISVKESKIIEPTYAASVNETTTSEPRPAVETTSQVQFTLESKSVNDEPILRKKEVNYDQKLSERSRERKVPASQLSRLMSYGASSAPLLDNSIFLNEANAERIVNTLCRVRGAALKLGQMLSLQDNSIMNPQLQNVFERVRQSADFMPTWQAQKVLVEELGTDWKSKVASFEERPFAAASIGQVHLAVLPDGRKVAMKIQYPGVATSIESDIRNLTSTLKVWKIIPPGFFIEHLMAVARRELALEVDYINEAKCAKRFKELLKPYQNYFVPAVIDELSTRQVYTTELIDGLPLDKCFNLDTETRNQIASDILNLCLMELCQFNFMQTDPNWSNFFYNPTTQKLCLLDFGASREYGKDFVNKYIRIIKAAMDKNKELILKHSLEVGFLTGYESKLMENAHVDAVLILGEAFSHDGNFNFGTQDMTRRIQTVVPVMLENRLTPPPEEIYSLHRKLAGVFLLCTKLHAQINCKRLFDQVYENYRF